jgi:two-component system cell cycle sensor histidine kinase/response regulator CckA
MKRASTHSELLHENEELRARLEEAEETLWAIRNHEVDALVVEGPDGDQVYTLHGAERPYRVLVETMSEGALTMTPDGAVLYCNNQFSELVKLPLNKIMGASFYDFFVSQAHLQLFKAMLEACRKTGCRGEFLLKGATGQEVPTLLSGRLLMLNDMEVFCIVATDLSEQKRTQEALRESAAHLRQAYKMEAIGTLAGGIAHDFNNVLAAIIGFSEMARDNIPEGLPARRHMERVFAAGIRGRDLVKQILTFSRQGEQEKQPLKLAPVVKEALGLLRASLPSTVDIRTNLRSNLGFVLADPIQMQQIVMNLCTNAAHAMRQTGGSVSIDLTPFSFSSAKDAPDPTMKSGTYARLSVIDTGEGMSPEILEHIFDPFFTTKAAGEGTGLGLSVVHGIVTSHGGTITVSSEPRKGSTFTVYLPGFIEEQSGDSRDGESPVPRGRERILFVDDEADLAAMGDEMLTGLGYQVTYKTGAREALALFGLDPSRFDLVITDQTMPEMTGQDLVREVLALRADTPVIMLTGFSHLVDADKAKAAGIRAFAMKPLTRREIAQTIRKVLDG